MTLYFKIEDKEESIKFENNFTDLIESYEESGQGSFDLEKHPISEFEAIFNNYEKVKLEESLKFEFKGYDGKSIEQIIKSKLFKYLDTDKRSLIKKEKVAYLRI